MKIIVITIITRLELGGAQQLALHTVEGLERKRFQPYLMAGQGEILDPDAVSLGDVPVHFLPDLVREVRPHRDILALRQIRASIRRIRGKHPQAPVVVHTHSSKAGILGRWAAWLEGVPTIIHTFHGFGFHRAQRPMVSWFFQLVERWTGKITHGHIMVSRSNMEKALHLGIVPKGKMMVIRGGIPVKDFQDVREPREAIRRSLGVKEENVPLVTMVSCLKPQKAPEDFVGVARWVSSQEPRSRFLLVGDGVLRPQVEAAVKAAGLQGRFTLLGWRRDVPRILHATDVLVLTSRWEGLPLVLPQAMAVGIPAVATAVDGSPEVIRDGENGFLLASGDVDGMAQRVVQLIRDPALRSRMGEEGRKRVADFELTRMINQQEAFYQEMVGWTAGH